MITDVPLAVPAPLTSRHLLPYTRSSWALVEVQDWLLWPWQSQMPTTVPLACDAPVTSRHRLAEVLRMADVLLGGGLVGGGLVGPGVGGVSAWNWAKNFHTSPLVHVRAPLSPPPSTGPGV